MGGLRRRGKWLVLLTALAMLVVAAPASAATKPFSLVITTSAPTYDSASGTTGSGQTVQITAKFTNENTTQQMGSADLGTPSSLTATAATIPGPGSAKPGTCSGQVTGPCVELRSLSLAPGASVTVTITVQTQACAQGAATWSVEAKQANNFSGTPGNDLTLDTNTSNLVTALDGACHLAFVTQPHNALINQAISGVDFNPMGGPVTVQVRDSAGNVVAGSTASIAMKLSPNPGGAALAGTNPQAADGTDGTASFPDLTVNKAANGYAMGASSGTMNGGTSNPFNVQDQIASCPSNGSCKTDVGTTNNGNHASVVATAVSSGGLLLESVNANAGAQLVCQGYKSADSNTYESATTFDASKVITTTIASPAIHLSGNANQILKAQQICFGAPYEFTTASGAPAAAGTLPDGTAGFIGLLQACTGSTVGPCHDRKSDTTVPDPNSPLGFDIVLVADVPAGLPGDPWHT